MSSVTTLHRRICGFTESQDKFLRVVTPVSSPLLTPRSEVLYINLSTKGVFLLVRPLHYILINKTIVMDPGSDLCEGCDVFNDPMFLVRPR